MRKFFLSLTILSLFSGLKGQDKTPVKFGKISADDFKTTVYTIDSNASAIVIADIGSSAIVGNSKGWFSIEFRHFKRVHILNKGGYDLSDVEIPLYTDGKNEEILKSLKAYTYNLENGKIVETKVDPKTSVFKDNVSKNQLVKKFAFPAVKEGSIIEYEYTVESDFIFNLQPWEFQGGHPRLWTEYQVSIPEFLYYVFLSQGLQYDLIKTQKTRQENYRVSDSRIAVNSESFTFTSGVTDHRMVMKNVPALKEEIFTSTVENHIAKIEFQLAEFRHPLAPRNVMGDWTTVCSELLKDENFGQQLSRDNSWMNEEIKLALKDAKTDIEKAVNIYKYIQNNFTCTSYSRIYTDQPLKKILNEKKGSEVEINLLLTAMLRKAGLAGDPVMLSTKSHGYTYPFYPIMDRFNYVLCRTSVNGKPVYLDASRPRLGFGRLHWECYNGHARVINPEALAVELSADSLSEMKMTSLMLYATDKGIMGHLQQTPGYYESYSLRNRIKEKGQEEFIKGYKKDFGPNIEITGSRIDSLDNIDEQIQLNFDVRLNLEKDDIIYINPVFGEGYKENPFKSAQRSYPVEMPYVFDELVLLRMDVPEGYEVDELPKSIRVNFDEEGRSFFEYLIENRDGVISFRSRIKLLRTYYMPDEYVILRDFFGRIVSKHGEQIVFKKKK